MSNLKFDFDAVSSPHVPLSERVLDRMGDILFASDEILDMIATARRFPDDTTREIEQTIRTVFNRVNELMKQLCD